MASARPDGYTIGQVPISVTRFSQLGKVQLDPLKDLAYIARVSGQTFGIAVVSDAPWATIQDLVAAAKAKPGSISYGVSGIGGATHVGMEEFALAAGAKFNVIPFKGGAEALNATLGKHVDVLADSSSWAPHVQSGRMRLLATWGSQRTHDFKNVPTLKESGYDVVVDAPNGVAAPAGVPDQVLARLRAAFASAAASEEFKTACARIDAPIMYLDGPKYQEYVTAMLAHEKSLIERLNLKALLASS
jgi:tripartite-type tricarboxylate transporter receptor subunit TctC